MDGACLLPVRVSPGVEPWFGPSAGETGAPATSRRLRCSGSDLSLLCRMAALAAARHDAALAQEMLATCDRSAPVARARQLAMYLAHVALGLTQSQVAEGFRRDRRTVAHACLRIEERREVPAFDGDVTVLEAGLRWVAAR